VSLGIGRRFERIDEEGGPCGYRFGVDAGERVAGGVERCELHGEVADGGALGGAQMDFKAGGLLSEPVQEGVAASATDDEEPPKTLSCELSDAAEDLRISRGE